MKKCRPIKKPSRNVNIFLWILASFEKKTFFSLHNFCEHLLLRKQVRFCCFQVPPEIIFERCQHIIVYSNHYSNWPSFLRSIMLALKLDRVARSWSCPTVSPTLRLTDRKRELTFPFTVFTLVHRGICQIVDWQLATLSLALAMTSLWYLHLIKAKGAKMLSVKLEVHSCGRWGQCSVWGVRRKALVTHLKYEPISVWAALLAPHDFDGRRWFQKGNNLIKKSSRPTKVRIFSRLDGRMGSDYTHFPGPRWP